MSYLSRFFNTLPISDQDSILDENFSSFGHYLTRYHESNGDYKSAFESIMHNPNEIFSWFYERKDNSEVYKMFIANPQLVDIIKDSFSRNYNYNTYIIVSNQTLKGIWTFNCILADAPEYYYIDFLSQNPNLIITVVRNAYDLFRDVPETEYPRIYYKFKTYLNQFNDIANENDNIFYNLLVDVRFGPEINEPIIISTFNNHQKCLIAKAAVLGNKIEIFHQIFDSEGGELFMDALKQYYLYGTMEHLLIIFAGLKYSSNATIMIPKNYQLIYIYPALSRDWKL